MLDMNATGMKITTRLIVVAMTGSAISAVASFAAANGVSFFSSTNRKMFSSTTIASSMTMPTISTSASIVTLLSVKSSACMRAKVEMTDAGMATLAMMVARQLRMNSSTTRRRQQAAEQQMAVDLVERRGDVARLILNDVQTDVIRQLVTNLRQQAFHRVDGLDGVRAALAADLQDHRRHAVEHRERPTLFGPVFGPTDVADPDRRAVHRLDHEIVEIARIRDSTERSKGLLVGR